MDMRLVSRRAKIYDVEDILNLQRRIRSTLPDYILYILDSMQKFLLKCSLAPPSYGSLRV